MVSDDLLIRYFHKLEERGLGQWVERAIPNREVFEELSRFHGLSLEEAVRRLVEKLRSVVVPEVAEEVVGGGGAVAVEVVARRLAFWYIQLAAELGVLSEKVVNWR
ncbi:MAG: hypothetical protein QW680_03470 [Pyrobaculum sp.]